MQATDLVGPCVPDVKNAGRATRGDDIHTGGHAYAARKGEDLRGPC